MRARILGFLIGLLSVLILNLIFMGLAAAFIVVFITPFFVYFRTGLIRPIPEMDLVYKMTKFVLFSATSVSIILCVSTFFFPEDTKTKKYWWNKEINKKD